LANHLRTSQSRVRKVLFTSVVYTNSDYVISDNPLKSMFLIDLPAPVPVRGTRTQHALSVVRSVASAILLPLLSF